MISVLHYTVLYSTISLLLLSILELLSTLQVVAALTAYLDFVLPACPFAPVLLAARLRPDLLDGPRGALGANHLEGVLVRIYGSTNSIMIDSYIITTSIVMM